jgi:hypothetical protein
MDRGNVEGPDRHSNHGVTFDMGDLGWARLARRCEVGTSLDMLGWIGPAKDDGTAVDMGLPVAMRCISARDQSGRRGWTP